MAGLFGISIDSNEIGTKNFIQETLFWGTRYNMHLGGGYYGWSYTNGSKLIVSRVETTLTEDHFQLPKSCAYNSISYCGSALEPFHVKNSKLGPFALCFSGNITNSKELMSDFYNKNHFFETFDNIELIANLIVQGKDFVDGIKKMNLRVRGAFSLIILSQEGIYAVCCPGGYWPLIIGVHKKIKSIIVSSECVGFFNMDFNIIRNIEPGEIVKLDNGTLFDKFGVLDKTKQQRCSFYPVYTSSPGAIVYGLPAAEVRKKLGACLALEDIKRGFVPHLVIPVPDSGRFHAIGYHQEFLKQLMAGKINQVPFYDEPLIKYGFVRSFLGNNNEERKKRAHYKIVITGENLKHFIETLQQAGLGFMVDDILSNKRIKIVVCDDSVVRGVQIKSNLVPKIKYIFEKMDIKAEIHIRASYPELLSYCPFGTTTKRGETLAELHPEMSERIKFLGVDSLAYNTKDDLINILGLPKESFCMNCAE
jgi:amidophosphoribosyltransferase